MRQICISSVRHHPHASLIFPLKKSLRKSRQHQTLTLNLRSQIAMDFLSGFELMDPQFPSIIYRSSSISFFPDPSAADFLDLLLPVPEHFHSIRNRAEIRTLTDRVAALELELKTKPKPKKIAPVDRTYKWTTEIKGNDYDRKYKVTAEKKAGEEKTVKWSAEFKGKGKNASKTYTFETSSVPATAKGKVTEKDGEKEKKDKKKVAGGSRIVEIEDEPSPGAVVIRKTFMKRAVDRSKGKRKEMSPEDAAEIIQMTFRAYMVRRSQVLRALRELAVAKAKLKELRALFLNFSYRGRIAKDAEERQRFTERVIVLLLTVDSIEGPDYMVRAAKKSMVVELEEMLQVVEPQPSGKLASFKRRKFDLPEGGPISKEMSVGVTEVVQMLEHEDE